jgi:XTP/dITP diphosphohydrolase
VLDGIPAGLPALLLAAKLRYRATHGGIDLPMADEPARAAAAQAVAAVGPDGIGALLAGLVAEAHGHGIDPEVALRAALRDYAERVRAAEASAAR